MSVHKTSLSFGLAFAFAAALMLVAPTPASAASVTINGPATIPVPYGQCVNATWTLSASFSPTFCEWSWNGSVVSNGSSYSRTFCNPGLDYAAGENASLFLYVSNGSQSASDSHSVRVNYEPSCGWPSVFC